MHIKGRLPSCAGWGFVLVVAAVAGCGRNDVQVYHVAKGEPQAQAQQMQAQMPGGAMPAGHPDIGGGRPKVDWKLPAGWQEVPAGEMRVGSFRVAGKDGKQADVSIIPLPGLGGGDLGNVNRWRGQVGLGPVTEEELPKVGEPVEVGGQKAQLYDQAGENPGSGEKSRILAVIQRRENVAWFFKMTGDDALVAQQKPAFIEFLKSLTFTAALASMAQMTQMELPASHPPIDGAGTAAMAATTVVTASEAKPKWQVPTGWQETSGGPFLVAKFLISGAESSKAAVNVSMSPGEGGGLLGNVNRWRRQIGLKPVSQEEAARLVTLLETAGGKAEMVDMTGTDASSGQKTRVIGAVVPRKGQTWFYKLMGGEALVQREKDAFTKFVQSAQY